MNIHTDRHTDGRTEYQTNGRREDKTMSTMIYNHNTHRQTNRSNGLMNERTSKKYVPTTFGIHASKLVVRPTRRMAENGFAPP